MRLHLNSYSSEIMLMWRCLSIAAGHLFLLGTCDSAGSADPLHYFAATVVDPLLCCYSAGSQFFITYNKHPHLNGEPHSTALQGCPDALQRASIVFELAPIWTAGKYTIFAHVIDGMDVLDSMEKVQVGEICS